MIVLTSDCCFQSLPITVAISCCEEKEKERLGVTNEGEQKAVIQNLLKCYYSFIRN